MSGERSLDRRGFLARGLAAASAALLGGCEDLSDQPWVRRVLDSAETLTRVTQQACSRRRRWRANIARPTSHAISKPTARPIQKIPTM